MAKVERTIWYPPPSERTWRQDPRRGKGGVLADLGTHLIDLLRFLIADEIVDLTCLFEKVMYKEVEDSAVLAMRFSKGCLGTINVHWNIPFDDNFLQIYGTEGSLIVQKTIGPFSDGEMKWYNHNDGRVREVRLTPKDPYQAEIEHFIECIEKNKSPIVDAEEGLKDTQILVEAYKSAKVTSGVIEEKKSEKGKKSDRDREDGDYSFAGVSRCMKSF